MIYLLPQTIDQSAERFPEQEAFRFGSSALTYAELVKQTNQLAQLLIAQGVKRGDRVGIYLNRCLETAVAVYGIMKAGAAYVPLDPSAPATRTQFLLGNCGIAHIITNKTQKRRIAQLISPTSKIEAVIGIKENWPIETIGWEEVWQQPSSAPDINILANDLAYIMYTSGSTGAPKGIMHTHRSGLNYAKLSADLYGLNANDRIGNHAPLHFDISTLGYFTSPLVGATTVIVSDAHTKMPTSLAQLLEQEQLTVWYSVPLALTQMLERGGLAEKDMSALRWVLYGGEPFPIKHLRSLMQMWPNTQFSNVYGPAEVNQCTYYHIPKIPELNEAVPLGQVWKNTEMLILDEFDQPTPTGEIGELLIRTATMMDGYWKQPQLTHRSSYLEKGNDGLLKRFYRTGDLVQYNDAGELMFMGRKDRQIKTRGYRVELDEVEAILLNHDNVADAAVFSIQDEEGILCIEAAVTLRGSNIPQVEDLQTYMKGHMPVYAAPRNIHIYQTLPRTSTGKINRLALKEQVMKV